MTQQKLLQGEFNPAVPTRIVFGNGKIDSLKDEIKNWAGNGCWSCRDAPWRKRPTRSAASMTGWAICPRGSIPV